MPFAPSIVALNLLENIDDLPTMVKEVERVLKTGGVFAFHTINRTWYFSLLAFLSRAQSSPSASLRAGVLACSLALPIAMSTLLCAGLRTCTPTWQNTCFILSRGAPTTGDYSFCRLRSV